MIHQANRFLDGETEEEKFERVQKEAGIKKEEMEGSEGVGKLSCSHSTDAYSFIAKKAPSKPVESLKPRTRADFEEFRQLLTDLILQQSVSLRIEFFQSFYSSFHSMSLVILLFLINWLVIQLNP